MSVIRNYAKSLASIERCLELVPTSANTFITKNLPEAPLGSKGTFGGTLVAQSLLAALHCIPTHFSPTSLHAYFINGGDPKTNITYQVEDLRHGRNFIHKQVRAFQHDRLVFTSLVLFATQRQQHDSLHHMKTADLEAVPLSDFSEAADLFESKVTTEPYLSKFVRINEKFKDSTTCEKYLRQFGEGPLAYRFPADIFHSTRHTSKLNYYVNVRQPICDDDGNTCESKTNVFSTNILSHRHLKSITPENDPRYNYVALSYLSDSYLLFTLPYFHRLPLYSHKFSVSLDHSLHFHRLPRVNKPMLVEITNPRSNLDKHVLQGEYFDGESGQILATVTQEGYVVYDSESEIRAKL